MSIASLKKGDTVILKMFTGCPVGVKTILAADKTTLTIETGKGDTVFSKKTGKQIEPAPSQDKYANFVVEDDGSFVPPNKKSKKQETAKKSKKKSKPEPEEEEDEDIDDDEYEEA